MVIWEKWVEFPAFEANFDPKLPQKYKNKVDVRFLLKSAEASTSNTNPAPE